MLAITEVTNSDYYHYQLTIQAVTGRVLDLRVQFRTELVDVASIEALIERLRRVLVAMTADPMRRLSSMDVLHAGEHVGRADEQVKICGDRIELGEVRAVSAGVDGVQEAVVIAREDRPGNKRLVGYVTGTTDPAIARQPGRPAPSHTVPPAIVVLSAPLLTVNGELDKRALPAPLYSDAESYRAPANAIEESVAGISSGSLSKSRTGLLGSTTV